MIVIMTIEELQKIGNDVGYPRDGDYELGNDIDASDTVNWNGGLGFDPIGDTGTPFIGTLDGLGRSIIGLTINRPEEAFIGAFVAMSEATVRNIRLINFDITSAGATGCLSAYISDSYVNDINVVNCHIESKGITGAIVGEAQNTIFEDCITSGEILDVTYGVGGLCGSSNFGCEWLRCASSVGIYGATTAGGIVGAIFGSDPLTQCEYTGKIITNGITSEDIYAVGGLVGDLYGRSQITLCSVNADILLESTDNDVVYVGGLLGIAYQGANASQCYFSGKINAKSDLRVLYVGGLVSHTSTVVSYEFSNCYVQGEIICIAPVVQHIGGFAGDLYGGGVNVATNCYAAVTMELTGSQSLVGGFTGESPSVTSCYWDKQLSGVEASASGTGKTTSEMKQQITFVDWDFETPIWYIDEGKTYPTFFAPPTATPLTGDAPLTVSFAPGSIKAPAWQFGDGAKSALAAPRHTYYMPGSYRWRCEG